MDRPQKDFAGLVVLGWKPCCPCGGTWSTRSRARSLCTAHGTDAKPLTIPLRRRASFTTSSPAVRRPLRVPIDWNRDDLPVR
jgi:hypothetical protein